MSKLNIFSVLNIAGLTAMITVNTLANTLPINGKTTGEVSAQFDNLFTPAGFTFSIWSVIYLGLIAFVVYQFRYGQSSHASSPPMASAIGWPFLISCIANSCWIFAWHHEYLGATLVFMGILLLSLIVVNVRAVRGLSTLHTKGYRWFVIVPLGLYLGWICIATIANMSVFLTAAEWDAWEVSPVIWATMMSCVGALVGLLLLMTLRLVPAAVAICWGLFGLLMKQWQNDGPSSLMLALMILIGLLLIGMASTYSRTPMQNLDTSD